MEVAKTFRNWVLTREADARLRQNLWKWIPTFGVVGRMTGTGQEMKSQPQEENGIVPGEQLAGGRSCWKGSTLTFSVLVHLISPGIISFNLIVIHLVQTT